jgi:tRNA-Thr(GGU) m(6)t(6)A37 methyltransferase TsaA
LSAQSATFSAELTLRPIGHIDSPYTRTQHTPEQTMRNARARGRVVLQQRYAAALADLAGFDHAWLITWLHQAGPVPAGLRVVPLLLRHEPRGIGVFATRYPSRPNPLGLHLIQVLDITGPVLRFAGVDMVHGTPVLDIKPWAQRFDIPGYRPGDNPELDELRCGWYEQALAGAPEPTDRPPTD